MLKQIIQSIIVVGALSACSPRQALMQERARTQPPTGKHDVGVMLDGAKPEQVLNVLQAHANAQVRVLSKEHGLYEIFGVDAATLKTEVDASVSPNEFFEMPNKKAPHSKIFSVPAPGGLQVGSLAACVEDADSPTAVLTVEQPANVVNGGSFEIGQTVKINAKKSEPSAGTPSQLKTVIAVGYPETSSQGEVIKELDSYEFTPDTLGLYTIVVLVQDGRNVCALDGVQIIATANRKYVGKAVPVPSVDLTKFKHLNAVNADKTWQVSQGQGMVIAVVDSGVNYNHPSLAPNIYTNDKEIPDNQIDDDGNGFVDDYVGYDFVNADAYPYDDDSHGTHVAGLAAGKQFGLARNAQILPVKAMNSIGGDIGTIAAAIRYAVDRGANIINLSLGAAVSTAPEVLASAIDYAEQKGVLVVAAAGNGDENGKGYDIDSSPVFPASLPNDNIVTVAASSDGMDLAPYSNFGAKGVDVVAPGGMPPGDLLVSAAYENPKNAQFLGMAGTSMASPVVAGIAADVWAKNRNLTYKQVKDILINAGQPSVTLKDRSVSGRHIDAFSAVNAPAPTPADIPVLN